MPNKTQNPATVPPLSDIKAELELLIKNFVASYVQHGQHYYPHIEKATGLKMYGDLCKLLGKVEVLADLESLFAKHLK